MLPRIPKRGRERTIRGGRRVAGRQRSLFGFSTCVAAFANMTDNDRALNYVELYCRRPGAALKRRFHGSEEHLSERLNRQRSKPEVSCGGFEFHVLMSNILLRESGEAVEQCGVCTR